MFGACPKVESPSGDAGDYLSGGTLPKQDSKLRCRNLACVQKLSKRTDFLESVGSLSWGPVLAWLISTHRFMKQIGVLLKIGEAPRNSP